MTTHANPPANPAAVPHVGEKTLPTLTQAVRPLLWLAGIGLSIAPPLLVVIDRWMFTDLSGVLRSLWCQSSVLCRSALPSYFGWIVPAFGLFILLVLVAANPRAADFSSGQVTSAGRVGQRPGMYQRLTALAALALAGAIALGDILAAWLDRRQPEVELVLAILLFLLGSWLVETRLGQPLSGIRNRLAVILPLGAGQIALILTLRSAVRGLPGVWVMGALSAAVFYYLLRRVKPPPVYWVVAGTLVLMCIRLNSWQFSVVGDEYAFYSYAAQHLQTDDLIKLSANLFGGLAVYQTHPFFSSLIQMASMALLGADNFGWRFSSIYLAATSLFFFHSFFRIFLTKRAALWGVIFLGASQYLMTFGKIGYNNLQALFALGLVLWAAARAVQTRRLAAYAGLGISLGLCFYLYPAALYVVPLAGLFLLVFDLPLDRDRVGRWGLALAGLALFLIPLAFQPHYWLEKIPGTFLQQSAAVKDTPLAIHFGTNIAYALFSFVFAPAETHFVTASYLDPLSAALLPAGLAWTLKNIRRNRFALFWVLGFIYMLFAVGASHDRAIPSTTRMFMLLPWFCLFAALGLVWLAAEWDKPGGQPVRWRKVGAAALTGLAMAAMLSANLYMAHSLLRQRTVGVPSLEVLFQRLLQREQHIFGDSSLTYLFITGPNWGIDGIRVERDVYHRPASQTQLERIALETPLIPQEAATAISQENTLVIVQPRLDAAIKLPVEEQLANLGKLRCDVRDVPEKDVRFTLWLSEKWQHLCPWDGDWSLPSQ